jgi:tripeptide aminopeptidase
MESALDKFIRYAKIDTQSDENATTYPSTQKQFDLLNLLVKELKALGLKDVEIDQYGYVMATIPSNQGSKKTPRIGFVSHVDTSPSASGKDVKPNVMIYKGGDIVLAGNPSVVITEKENPELKHNIGKTIVTGDGTTLLGADDKAGVAIIMAAAQTIMNNPSIPHGDIRICFTPDEEIGAGTKYFDLHRFGCDFAYTVDGDTPGELNKETFSANLAVITVHGRNIHPGSAKNIMVNSIKCIADIISRFPKDCSPETTEGYEPYIHPHIVEGEEAKSTLKILLRDFNTPGLEVLKKKLETIIAEVQPLHPKAKIELNIIEQYRNMKDYMGDDAPGLACLWEATKRAGFDPKWLPIRGGTDGSRLTEKGLPCPNIFTGGQNYHGPTEWLSVWGMEKSVETVVNLAQVWVEKSEGRNA